MEWKLQTKTLTIILACTRAVSLFGEQGLENLNDIQILPELLAVKSSCASRSDSIALSECWPKFSVRQER
jgi:hypothetical protein